MPELIEISGLDKAHIPLGDFAEEIKGGLSEFVEPLKFFAVGTVWTAGDLAGHQLFEATAGERTPKNYYRNKLLLSPVALIAGRIVSDLIGGSPSLRAFTLATTANVFMQLRYLGILGPALSAEFNIIVFLIHEALLFPLSFLIIGKPNGVLLFKEKGY